MRYRVEWMHNGNWRMDCDGAGTFDTRKAAEQEIAKAGYKKVKTRIVELIDITPTWSGLLPALIDLLQCKKPDVRQQAYDEMVKMAKAADLYNESVKGATK